MSDERRVRPDYIAVEEFTRSVLEGSEQEAVKSAVLRSVLGFSDDVKKWLSGALRIAREALEDVARGYSAAGYSVVKLLYRLATPGLVGAGGGLLKPMFEVGLSVHPVLGLPYYPGSGLKGAVRSLAEVLLGEDAAEAVFGSTGEGDEAGAVVFSDMVPVGCSGERCSVYRGLVVTPHYHRGGRAVPNELYAVPSPVPHLGIEEGVVFGVAIAVHKGRARSAAEALRRALERGSGACGGAQDARLDVYAGLCSALRRAADSQLEPDRLVAFAAYVLLDAVLGSGIAARSTKGYNVFEKFEEGLGGLRFEVVGYSYEPQAREGGQGRQRGPRERRKPRRVMHRGSPGRGGRRQGRGPGRRHRRRG